MINSEINTMEITNNVAGSIAYNKQSVLATKKVALRDVQNNNNNLTHETHQQNLLPVDGRLYVDAAKTCGTKRLAPDYASPPVLSNNGANELYNYARRKYEFEGNQGRNLAGYQRSANLTPIQQEINQINGKNMRYGSLAPPKHTASKTAVPRFKESIDEQWTERFIRLQNFIKQSDGSNDRENIQLLLRLSPLELSRHAVELEKRAIQLTIEEGKEMQRMQGLNILGKPSTTKTPMPITPHIQRNN